MLVLGVETSCDETAVALYDEKLGVLGEKVHTQTVIHETYGGVVPELASRDHIRNLLPLIQALFEETNCTNAMIDGIAYTKGPGLIGALMVGAAFSKTLAYALKKKSIGLHHMESHLAVIGLLETPPRYPFVALLVSGGHTLLVHVKEMGKYTILGQTVDDAAGEAFDKVAKLLGLTYPGGAKLAQLAQQGDNQRFYFPRPMLDQANLNFSFSGLKTHAKNTFEKYKHEKNSFANIAVAFEEAAVDVLVNKCFKALEITGLDGLVLVGGVAANRKLRQRLVEKSNSRIKIYYPPVQWCTDNAVMVAYNGYLHFKSGYWDQCISIEVKPKWSLEEISI